MEWIVSARSDTGPTARAADSAGSAEASNPARCGHRDPDRDNQRRVVRLPGVRAIEAESLPTLRTQMGSRLSTVLYNAPDAARLYPGENLVPRYVLTHADGSTEKAVGYRTLRQLQDWIAGKTKEK